MQKTERKFASKQPFRTKYAGWLHTIKEREQAYEQAITEVSKVCPNYDVFPLCEMEYSYWLW